MEIQSSSKFIETPKSILTKPNFRNLGLVVTNDFNNGEFGLTLTKSESGEPALQSGDLFLMTWRGNIRMGFCNLEKRGSCGEMSRLPYISTMLDDICDKIFVNLKHNLPTLEYESVLEIVSDKQKIIELLNSNLLSFNFVYSDLNVLKSTIFTAMIKIGLLKHLSGLEISQVYESEIFNSYFYSLLLWEKPFRFDGHPKFGSPKDLCSNMLLPVIEECYNYPEGLNFLD